MRNHQPAELGSSEQIGIHLLAGFFHRNAFHGAEGAVAGVVYEHVDTPLGVKDGLDASEGRFRIGDVKLKRNDTEFPQRLEAVHPAGGRINLMTFAG